MFVRIMHYELIDREESPPDMPERRLIGDRLYECDGVDIRPIRTQDSGPDKLKILLEFFDNYELESNTGWIINKDGLTDVYIMNRYGETVETYRFLDLLP